MRASDSRVSLETGRRYAAGAEVRHDGTHFRVWAPLSRTVRVALIGLDGLDERTIDLSATGEDGYFEGLAAGVAGGRRYWIVLEDGGRYADPASRYQPEGPHGPSEVVDPSFEWSDRQWRGVSERTPLVYEMHVGTFTEEGTWAAAEARLPDLVDLGVSVVEALPIAEFPGRFGWGYDGVLWFAPSRLYGRPDDLRRFVNTAHRLGIGVILDVVYNHFGPDGCRLGSFSATYFARANEWGQGLNFDGPGSAGVRDLVVANAGYWIDEYHLDGLRLDATQAIHDASRPNILAEIRRAVSERAAGRATWVVGENEPQDSALLRPVAEGGSDLDALWNDDFHHTAMVALTGRREAYYTDYLGSPQEFISCAKSGFLYQGQWYSWQHQPRGTSARGLPPWKFVAFLQNHDQVANSMAGARLHQISSPGHVRALTALLLLGPWVPMLFQGQEFQASSPFLYFADHHGDLGAAVVRGRREFLSQFPSLAGDDVAMRLTDPTAEATFVRSKLDYCERETNTTALDLHRSLIALRRRDMAFSDFDRFVVDGAVLTHQAFVLRFMNRTGGADGPLADRLLVVNLGPDLPLPLLLDPLLSPHPAREWQCIWSSDDPAYGGLGITDFKMPDGWRLSAESAIVLAPNDVRT